MDTKNQNEPILTRDEIRKYLEYPPLVEGRDPAYISFPTDPKEQDKQLKFFRLAEKLSVKPLWLRLLQSYFTWRSNLLYKLGICYHCGWHKADHAGVCYDCWEDYLPVDRIEVVK